MLVGILGVIPILRGLWRWWRERYLELRVAYPGSQGAGPTALHVKHEKEGPIYWVNAYPGHPHIYAWLDIVLVNHRTNRKEQILGGELHLKKRRGVFWRKTIASTQST